MNILNPIRYVALCEGKNYDGISCIKEVTQKVYDYSLNKYGRVLCFRCQKDVEGGEKENV